MVAYVQCAYIVLHLHLEDIETSVALSELKHSIFCLELNENCKDVQGVLHKLNDSYIGKYFALIFFKSFESNFDRFAE